MQQYSRMRKKYLQPLKKKMETLRRAAYEDPREYFELLFKKSVETLAIADIKELLPKMLEISELNKSLIQNLLRISPEISQRFVLGCLKDTLQTIDSEMFNYSYKTKKLLEIAELFNTEEEFNTVIELYIEKKMSVPAESNAYWWEMREIEELTEYYKMDEEERIQFFKGLLEKDWKRFILGYILG